MTLRSEIFDDIYFSTDNGLAETRYVFLEKNYLSERFKNLKKTEKITFLELGLGTGLNFLATWELFEKTASEGVLLEFISCEQYPLDPVQIKTALSDFPELKKYLDLWLENYPLNIPGHHFLPIIPGRVHVHCLFGEVLDVLKELDCKADVLFLDGFAPSKNPAMWRLELFQEIGKLSHAETTFSSFTSARFARENLEQAGFEVFKTKGFGRKRDMIVGKYLGKNMGKSRLAPWLRAPELNQKPKEICVIGAGIAGCSMAWVLSQCGVKVSLLDSLGIAQAASGNPWGLIRPFLTVNNNLTDQMISQSAWLTMRTIKNIFLKNPDDLIGTEQIQQWAGSERLKKRYGDLFKQNHPALFKISGISESIYLIKPALMINPVKLCEILVKTGGEKISFYAEKINFLKYDAENFNWIVRTNLTERRFDAVILASGSETQKLGEQLGLDLNALPIKNTPGQISIIPAVPESFKIQEPICYEGYCFPVKKTHQNNQQIIGATYRNKDQKDREDLSVRESDHLENLENLKLMNPELGKALENSNPKLGRVSVRGGVLDHLPLIGPVISKTEFEEKYARLAYGDSQFDYPDLINFPGLFMTVGHGSKGLSTGLLSAWVIASYLLDQTLPVPMKVLSAVHSGRFLVRDLKRLGKTK